MKAQRQPLTYALVLAAGVAIGWASSSAGPRRALANGADRWGDRALASGPIAVEMLNERTSIPQDALYYLNYSTGKLYATVPSFQQSAEGSHVLTDFAERDLMADFGIKPGQDPHFLMTTGALGMRGQGWSPLFVIETETGQVATYKVSPQVVPGSTQPTFRLVERKADRRLGRAASGR